MNLSIKTSLLLVLTFALVLASGSVLNVLGLDEVIDLVLLSLAMCFSLRFVGVGDSYWSILFSGVAVVSLFFLLQSLEQGDLALFLNRNNLKFLVSIVTAIMSCGIFKRTGKFIGCLNTTLKLFLCYGLLSFLVCAILPPHTVLFKSFDGSAAYLSRFGLFFQRTHIDYFGVLAPSHVQLFGISFKRAHGLAWEPGNFAVFINILIFLNLFITRNRRWVILGIVGVLLSWSTVGLITLAFQLLCAFWQRRRAIFDRWFAFKMSGLIVLSGFLAFLVMTNYGDKIYGDNSGSGASRVINTVVAANTILAYPLLGTGLYFQNYQANLDSRLGGAKKLVTSFVDADKVNNVASTNSILRVFVHFGIPVGSVLVFGLFRQQLIPEHRSIFALVMLLSLSSAPLFFYPFFLMFSMSGAMHILGIDRRWK